MFERRCAAGGGVWIKSEAHAPAEGGFIERGENGGGECGVLRCVSVSPW